MNTEFHYYAIFALAREAGFDEATAFVLANASQEVDASTTPLAFDAPRGRVDIAVTQNYVFWDRDLCRSAYLPFHFVPGDPEAAAAARADGRRDPYAVTPNGELAKSLLVEALRDKDPYRMGVALHAFADTWAHQNFTGFQSPSNELQRDGSASRLPPAGHLQALLDPDQPDAVWEDPRLVPERRRVVNVERFSAAATKVFRYLRVYLGKPFGDESLVVDRLAAVWRKPSRDERLADYVIEWGMPVWERGLWRKAAGAPRSALPGALQYDKLAWAASELRAAMGSEPVTVAVDESFYRSDLYRWHEAAVEHRSRAHAALAGKGL